MTPEHAEQIITGLVLDTAELNGAAHLDATALLPELPAIREIHAQIGRILSRVEKEHP